MSEIQINGPTISLLRGEYSNDLLIAKRLCECISVQLQSLVDKNDLTLGVPIETRVKEWSSIEEKLSRKSLNVGSIRDLGDFVGARVILLFKSDLEKMVGAIKSNFQIITDEDVAGRLQETQFGYQSRHFLVRIPEAWCNIPSYAGLDALQAEIQVRTVTQHIWAAASHKLQYKREDSVPPQIRRAIHRVSALLETVDLEFERVLLARVNYLSDNNSEIDPNAVLDVELVSLITARLLPSQNREENELFDELLFDLRSAGINTCRELIDLINDKLEYAVQKDKISVNDDYYEDFADIDRINRGVYFTHAGLIRMMLFAK